MGLRPQTLYGLADSPIALAAWMLDHDAQSYEDIAQAFVAEQPVGNLTRDEVLDNITLTWLTNTGISSARLYWENTLGFFDAKGVTVPAAVSVFPRELYQAPRSWAEQAYPNLIYFNEVDRGNHFAAWQEPELFVHRGARGIPVAALGTVAARLHMPPLGRGDRVAQLRATRPRRAARPRRPGQLLDADLHQLAAPGAVRPRLVAGLPRRRAPRHRRPHAGVLLRARASTACAQATEERGIDYPVAARQRLRGLERLRQPLLAGAVLRRRARASSATSTSARAATRSRSASSSGCSASSASSSPSRGSASRPRPTGTTCGTPETYLGYARASASRRRDGAAFDERRAYELPERLRLNQWALVGEWTVGRESVVLERAGGSIAFRFQARDAHLVLSPGAREPIPFRVLLDGGAPGPSHGADVDADGNGVLRDGRLYQLVREGDAVRQRTLEITFLEPGADAYAFTFG